MTQHQPEPLMVSRLPELEHATLVLAFTGWMDGGEVSTGTVSRLVNLLEAEKIGEIDPEPFYIYNVPGSMEIVALFRPAVEIEDGLVKSLDMPSNTFYSYDQGNLLLFVGKEPNLRWRTFGECIFWVASRARVKRILFVGSFGGTVPHTRQPRLYASCSDPSLLPEIKQYGVLRSTYKGPSAFVNYLMTQAKSAGLEMISLAAEIPSYLQGANPASIEAVTRRLAKILKVPLDLDALRAASTEWELQVSSLVEENQELAETIRGLEQTYDTELLSQESDET